MSHRPVRVRTAFCVASIAALGGAYQTNPPETAMAQNVAERKAVSSGPAPRCPGITRALGGAPLFSTLVGLSGCLTPSAEAFLVLYRSRDLDGLRVLAKARATGAQLYALCGLKHLRADEEAKTLRQELAASQKTAAINSGCNGPGPMTPVSQLTATQKGQQASVFDLTCDYLIEEGMQSYRRPCDTERARPKCQ
jgi:hypothetical protein